MTTKKRRLFKHLTVCHFSGHLDHNCSDHLISTNYFSKVRPGAIESKLYHGTSKSVPKKTKFRSKFFGGQVSIMHFRIPFRSERNWNKIICTLYPFFNDLINSELLCAHSAPKPLRSAVSRHFCFQLWFFIYYLKIISSS